MPMTYHSPAFLRLQTEILKDRACMEFIEEHVNPNDGLEEKLAAVATYLNIAVGGMYDTPELCNMLATQLANKNSLIITTNYIDRR